MKIELRPELEALIQQDVQRGPYKNVDEFVEHAVSLLHEQEAWLAEQGSEIRAKIERAFASAQHRELIDSGKVCAELDEKKQNWQAEMREGRAGTKKLTMTIGNRQSLAKGVGFVPGVNERQ